MEQKETKIYYVCEQFAMGERKSIHIKEYDAEDTFFENVLYYCGSDDYEVNTDTDGLAIAKHKKLGLVFILRLARAEDIIKLFSIN